MKKLIIFLFLLFLLPCVGYAQIWEGGSGDSIQEGIGFGSGSGGGGWIPEPLDPNMTHYTISFKDDNQTTSLFSPIELNENTVVDLSVFVPTRSEGYDFSHWEDGNGDSVTSVTMTADTTVYAVWTVHTHSITWKITDYSQDPVATYASVDSNIAYGSVIVASSAPTVPSSYEFSGWNNLPLTMPDYDLVITGTIDFVDIVFTISETYDSQNPERYPVTYGGTIANYSPISYNNGVVDMGDWESWINDHFTPVMLRSDGTVDYELSRSNQNYKADGVTPSDISNLNYDGNAMLQIKKFYLSCSTETVGEGGSQYNVHTVKISDSKKDNTYTCWGFVDSDGVEQDYVYYSLFLCHKDSNNKLRSIAGATLSQSNHRLIYSDIVAAAKANGNGWNISNVALENALGLVLMMIYKDVNPIYVCESYSSTQSLTVAQVTGTRASDGGFPFSTTQEQPKALWLENYWRGYGENLDQNVWCNGLGALKATTQTSTHACDVYYKLTEPYNFTDLSAWTLMNNTQTYIYVTSSHELKDSTFYNNILFPMSNGVTRSGSVGSTTFNRYFGGGDINGSNQSYGQFSDSTLLPVKTGGILRISGYISPAHYLSYNTYGNDTRGEKELGSGRLTYLPQPDPDSGDPGDSGEAEPSDSL